ncbi:MAG: peptide-methionine (S)-S-oxide reductase [Candidatus Heimdallarchaeota archaeon]|nr:peptide-methionine (S)-S-oxide reductase [Candidatus Heimdallarchaeota archaeon]
MSETAYLGAGCFWHAELTFSKIDGIIETEVGFSEIETSKNKRNSVEVVKITYDPKHISFSQLIDTFWTTHDASSKKNLNENYGEKSIIFAINEDQQNQALKCLELKRGNPVKYSINTEVREHLSYKKAPNKDQKYYFKD